MVCTEPLCFLEEGGADLSLWKWVFVALCMAEADEAVAHIGGEFSGAPAAGIRKVHPSALILQSP